MIPALLVLALGLVTYLVVRLDKGRAAESKRADEAVAALNYQRDALAVAVEGENTAKAQIDGARLAARAMQAQIDSRTAALALTEAQLATALLELQHLRASVSGAGLAAINEAGK